MAASTAQKARAFDLFGKIMEYFSEEKRDPEKILDILQIVKDKKNFAEMLLAKAAEKIGNVFEVVCQGSFVASELVRRGKYDWVNDLITDKRFPIGEHVPQTRIIELVEFDYDSTSEEALRELERRGLERPTAEDALYFGIQHLEEQRKHPIVFLHEPVECPGGGRRVLVLRSDGGERNLNLSWCAHGWYRDHVFAGVRK